MPTFIPARLRSTPPDWVIILYCAAWCDTCTEYRRKFEAFAHAAAGTGDASPVGAALFVCVDIEDEPHWLGDEDVENFPTLGVQFQGKTLFFGTMLPHIGHLERLLQALGPDSPPAAVQLPPVTAHTAAC